MVLYLNNSRSARWSEQSLRLMLCLGLMSLSSVWLAPPRPAQAQSDITLNALTIELWPEYDQPSMLVILRGTLAPSVTLPTTVTVHIPSTSGGPSAVAAQDANGQLFDTVFTTTPAGETLAVQVQTSFASFQVEYYDPGLKITGEAREYPFQWVADFPVSAATVRVQEPIDARGLSAEPPITLAGSSGLGLNYYTASLGALSTGQNVFVHLRYTKSTSTLSVEKVGPTPAQAAPAPGPTPRRLELSPTLLIGGGLGLLSLALMSWGVIGLVRSRRTDPRWRRPGEPVPAPQHSPGPLLSTHGTAQFCTQCGEPTLAGDRFCRNCGEPIRSPQAE